MDFYIYILVDEDSKLVKASTRRYVIVDWYNEHTELTGHHLWRTVNADLGPVAEAHGHVEMPLER